MFAAILNSVAFPRSDQLIAVFNLKSVVFISLFLSLWMSAFAVVYTTYSTRQAYAELQSLRQQHDNLFMEWTQILLEQSAWADTGQIEQLAREDLSMRLPTLEEINFLVVEQ